MAKTVECPGASLGDAAPRRTVGWDAGAVVGDVAIVVGRSVLLVVVVVSAAFLLLEALPGDAASSAAGADTARVAQLRETFGLTAPVGERLLAWWSGAVRGDLGVSLQTMQPVAGTVSLGLARTLWLTVPAWAVGSVIGAAVALWMAWQRGTVTDRVTSGIVGVALGLPEAVWVMVCITVFAVWWQLVPAVSLIPPGVPVHHVPHLLALPVVALALPTAAWSARLMRGPADDAMRSTQVASARRRSTPTWHVIGRLVLPACIGPWAHVVAATGTMLVGGTVIVESLLGYDGLGRTVADSVASHDVFLAQGALFAITSLCVAMLAIADLVVRWRVRTGSPI